MQKRRPWCGVRWSADTRSLNTWCTSLKRCSRGRRVTDAGRLVCRMMQKTDAYRRGSVGKRAVFKRCTQFSRSIDNGRGWFSDVAGSSVSLHAASAASYKLFPPHPRRSRSSVGVHFGRGSRCSCCCCCCVSCRCRCSCARHLVVPQPSVCRPSVCQLVCNRRKRDSLGIKTSLGCMRQAQVQSASQVRL